MSDFPERPDLDPEDERPTSRDISPYGDPPAELYDWTEIEELEERIGANG